MKDAIWSAVPNLSVIVAGGDLPTMAVSLIAQVGIGYMNYRRERSKIRLGSRLFRIASYSCSKM